MYELPSIAQVKFEMRYGYILVKHRSFQFSNVHVLGTNVSCHVFLTNKIILQTFRKNYESWRS